MNARTSLTKSLHTVTAVSRIAFDVYSMYAPEQACRSALVLLGLDSEYPLSDVTFAKCVAAVTKARGFDATAARAAAAKYDATVRS